MIIRSWGRFVIILTERSFMITNNQLTNVVAAIFVFVALIISPSQTTTSNSGWSFSSVEAAERTSYDNSDNMKLAYAIGSEIGHPETMQALMLQESGGRSAVIGNKNASVSKRSYGIMQVQIVAARSVMQRYPDIKERYFPDRRSSSITNQELVDLLLSNDEANIRIAAYHFRLYLSIAKGNWDRAVAGYNMGIGNAIHLHNPSDVDYVVSVKQKLNKIVKPFNHKNDMLPQ